MIIGNKKANLVFVNERDNKNIPDKIIKSRDFIIKEVINFNKERILFKDINTKSIININLEINNNKIENNNETNFSLNLETINKNDNKLSIILLKDININLSIDVNKEIKNDYGSSIIVETGISFKEKLNIFNRTNVRDKSSDINTRKPGKLKMPDSLASKFEPKKVKAKENYSSRKTKHDYFHFNKNNAYNNENNIDKMNNTANLNNISCDKNLEINDNNIKKKKVEIDKTNIKDEKDKEDIKDIKDNTKNLDSIKNDNFTKDSDITEKIIEKKKETKIDTKMEIKNENKSKKENKQKNDKKLNDSNIWNIDSEIWDNTTEKKEENSNEEAKEKELTKDEIKKEENKKEEVDEKNNEKEMIKEEINTVKESYTENKNLNEEQNKLNENNKFEIENKEKNNIKENNNINHQDNDNLMDDLYEDIEENETEKNVNINNINDQSELNKISSEIEKKPEEIEKKPEEIENKTEEIKNKPEEINPQTKKLEIINLPKRNERKELSKSPINNKLKKIVLYDANANTDNNNYLKNSNYQKTTRESSFKNIFRKSKSGKVNSVNKNYNVKRKSECVERLENIQSMLKYPSKIDEIFLDSVNYEDYLKSLEKKGLKYSKRETFCEAFFVASIPYQNGKVVENSQNFPSTCGHLECSKLPSMKPEIIMRYPLKDTKNLELNNLAATLCFPTGIKMCYSEQRPPNIKDYVTPITNQKGDRYYMMTHHFYLKLTDYEYGKRYEVTPFKFHLKNFGDAYLSLNEEEFEEKKEEIQDNLKLCQELGFRENVYVPFCLCLISKYPYVQELKKCLMSIYKLIMDKNSTDDNSEINDLIMHLIHSIPIPDTNSRVKFFIPYFVKGIDISCPKIEDISIMNYNSTSLLKIFSTDNLLTIFKLLINEKKILFIDKYYERLAKVTDGFISLLYPLQWIHTYIPIMSDQMVKYLETFLPFLNGIHSSLMSEVEKIFKESDFENEEVFLVYINDDKIRLSSYFSGKKIKADKYIQENIPSLPSSFEKDLRKRIKKIKGDMNNFEKKKSGEIDNQYIELQLRDAFIEFFANIFHDYDKFLYFLDEEDVVFNKALFLQKIPNSDKKFYDEIIDTQLFQQFTQNVIKEDYDYFNYKIQYNSKDNNKQLCSRNALEKDLKIDNIYIVRPDYLNIKDNGLGEIEFALRSKYPNAIKDILINNDKVLNDIKYINENNYINNNCIIYITPLQLLAEMGDFHGKNDFRQSQLARSGIISRNTQGQNLLKVKKTTTIKKDCLDKLDKEKMKEYIKDFVIKILKSEDLNVDEKEKNEFQNVIDTDLGRGYFINILSHNAGNVVYIEKKSFDLLGTLIYNSILFTLKNDETNKLIEEVVLLIKSTKYFCLVEKGKSTILFDKYKRKIQSNPKILQQNFWEIWYDIELRKKEDKDTDKVKQKNIYDICNAMIEMEIPKTIIKNIIEEITYKIFGKESEITQETFKNFREIIISARYISKAMGKKK